MKSKKQESFTQIPNRILNDKRLSLAAKGLLSIMLSNSDAWKIYMGEIYTRSKNSAKSQQGTLKELKALGYVDQRKIRNPDTHQFEWLNKPLLFPMLPQDEKPHMGNAPMENKSVESEPAPSLPVGTGGNNNTNENNTELTNTNIDNTKKEEEIEKEKKEEGPPLSISTNTEIHPPKREYGTKEDVGGDLPF